MKKLLFSICVLTFCTSVYSQGPLDGFSKGKGNGDIGFSFTSESGDNYWAPDDFEIDRTINSYCLYGIYGITDKLDAQLTIPLISTSIDYFQATGGNPEEPDEAFGIQDGSLYLKYNFFSKEMTSGKLNLFGAYGLSVPLADYETEGLFARGQKATTNDIRFIAQYEFGSFFAMLQGGYLLKSGDTPDAFSGVFKFGYTVNKIYADIWFEILESDGGTDFMGDNMFSAATGGFRGLGVDYTKIGATVYYSITDHFGAFAGVANSLSGRNTNEFFRFNIGVNYKL